MDKTTTTRGFPQETDENLGKVSILDRAFRLTSADAIRIVTVALLDAKGVPNDITDLLSVREVRTYARSIAAFIACGPARVTVTLTDVQLADIGAKSVTAKLAQMGAEALFPLIQAASAPETSPVVEFVTADTHQEPRATRELTEPPPFASLTLGDARRLTDDLRRISVTTSLNEAQQIAFAIVRQIEGARE